MDLTGSPLSTMMAIAAWFLGLSLFVQVLQELYKQLTSSKSRAYSAALIDFAGPFAAQLLQPDVAPDLTIRGPFQFRRLRPQGRLQPLEKESLVSALERTQPTWYRLTRQALEFEEALQTKDRLDVSPTFKEFLKTLGAGLNELPGKYDAAVMKNFLEDHGHVIVQAKEPKIDTLDAARLLREFRVKYSPQILKVDEHFEQLMQNFENVYRRRNLRQTFVFAFVLAIWFDFSFDAIYARAASSSQAEATAAAVAATRAFQASQPAAPSTQAPAAGTGPGSQTDAARAAPTKSISYLPQPGVRAFGRRTTRAVGAVLRRQRGLQSVALAGFRSAPGLVHYTFGCLVTAVLICFGAPFWNDLTKSLLRVSQGETKPASEPDKR